MIDEIKKLGLVKYVSLDMSYKKGLLSDDDYKVGSFFDGGKKPGKIFTKMSFCEADEHGQEQEQDIMNLNGSVNLRRQLLIQVDFFVLVYVVGKAKKITTLICYLSFPYCRYYHYD